MRRILAVRMSVLVIGFWLTGFCSCFAPCVQYLVADEPEKKDAEKSEAKERKARYLKWMREYSEGTTIRLASPGPGTEPTAELVAQPIFRYSGDVYADDATLWVWTHNARPVAFQKVEVNNIGGSPKWTICFGSAFEDLLDVSWPGDRRFAARAPGVKFRPIPEAAAPSDKAKTRTAQIKSLKDRFTGQIAGWGPKGRIEYDLRPIPTPIFEYADPVSKMPLGAVFSLVNHEGGELTPVFLLSIEARTDSDGKLRWEYASRRLTIWKANLKLDDTEVVSLPLVDVDDQVHDDWTFYMLVRSFD